MSDYDFNSLHDDHVALDVHDDHGITTPALHGDRHEDSVQALVHDSKGKHGKKDHQVEPAPAPEAVDVEDVDLSKPLAPTMAEGSAFLRFLPPLIRQLNSKGVPFKIDGATGEIAIDGFYRSGGITLEIADDNAITAVDRRGTRTPVNTFDDLVALNYDWWIRTNGKTGENHINPDRPWLDELLNKRKIRRQVIYVPSADAPADGE